MKFLQGKVFSQVNLERVYIKIGKKITQKFFETPVLILCCEHENPELHFLVRKIKAGITKKICPFSLIILF